MTEILCFYKGLAALSSIYINEVYFLTHTIGSFLIPVTIMSNFNYEFKSKTSFKGMCFWFHLNKENHLHLKRWVRLF